MDPQDGGFVLDEASGLYFHASSGFYHDPIAGWYYNSHDGVYYKFEEGAYVPIAANNNSGSGIADSESRHRSNIESATLGEDEQIVLDGHESWPSQSLVHVDGNLLVSRAVDGSDGSRESTEDDVRDIQEDVSLEVGFPLWHYDSLRSVYWYYDQESKAYYKYCEVNKSLSNENTSDGASTTVLGDQSAIRAIGSENAVHEHNEVNIGEVEGFDMQAKSQHGEGTDNLKPTSGWLEEALIDLYLKGYPREDAERDKGPWITSADIFLDGSPKADFELEYRNGESYGGGSLATEDQPPFANTNFSHDMRRAQNLIEESDEESEELEEGEWVPEEPLRIVDGNLGLEGGAYSECEENRDGETCESMYSVEPSFHHDDFEEGEVENCECVQDSRDGLYDTPGELCVEVDGEHRKEEQWQAQFGQVVREKSRQHAIPGAVDLWDWIIVEMEPKTLKPGKMVKKLVGRIASSVTKLVCASNGLIRTSAIHAAELDFVKVSSGKIYRLRRPSLKHLMSLGTYDSSNPTKDWGFPDLGLSLVDSSANALENELRGDLQIKTRTDPSLSKPFVPNFGHWQFQQLVAPNNKKGRGVPAALVAYKYLSSEEILVHEQRKQKYRDRAAERRNLHGGFGTGPGQKSLTPHEQDKLDAESEVELGGALKKAAAAPPLGRENVGKRMLEGMGWREGQTLGVEGGLATPLQAQGNDGRAGVGWR